MPFFGNFFYIRLSRAKITYMQNGGILLAAGILFVVAGIVYLIMKPKNPNDE